MMKRLIALCIIALLASLWPTMLRAQAGDGEMVSDSYWVRMYVLNNAGRSSLQNPYYRARACIGELSGGLHSSPSFQVLSGFCAQAHWYLTEQPLIDVYIPDLIIDTGLGMPYPNPAFGQVRLSFAVRAGEVGKLRIYDLTGRLVRNLLGELKGPTSQSIRWDLKDGHGRQVPAGVYFARLETSSRSITRQMVLLGQ